MIPPFSVQSRPRGVMSTNMDPPWGSFTSKASSIPRLSRLPLPCAAPVRSVRPSPSREKLSADKGLNISKLQSTSSRDTISWSTSPKPQIRQNAVVSGLHPKATAPASSKVKGPESISGHDAVEDPRCGQHPISKNHYGHSRNRPRDDGPPYLLKTRYL
jgi:hypothetical protein